MDRQRRLTGSSDFQRVRTSGTSYAHPFVVLVACPNDMPLSRFGVTAGRQLGSAVRRNRAKRRLRAALDALQPHPLPGWGPLSPLPAPSCATPAANPLPLHAALLSLRIPGDPPPRSDQGRRAGGLAC